MIFLHRIHFQSQLPAETRCEAPPEGYSPELFSALREFFITFSESLSQGMEGGLENLGGGGTLIVRGRLRLRPGDQMPLLGLVASYENGPLISVWQWENSAEDAPALAAQAIARLQSEGSALKKAVPLTATLKADVVLEPWLASLFVHEVVGHLAEADNFLSSRLSPRPGERVSACPITVIDDPGLAGTRTRFTEDDEGNPAEALAIIEAGLWRGVLCNNAWEARVPGGFDTAKRARRARSGQCALPRQSNTYLRPHDSTQRHLIETVQEGYLILGGNGGGSAGPQYFLRPIAAQRIHQGRLADEFLNGLVIGGSKRQALAAISAVGGDFEMFSPFYGCDKEGSEQLPVCHGAPSILLRQIRLYPKAMLILKD